MTPTLSLGGPALLRAGSNRPQPNDNDSHGNHANSRGRRTTRHGDLSQNFVIASRVGQKNDYRRELAPHRRSRGTPLATAPALR